MKYSFEDKLKAVKYYLEKGTYLYPDNLKTPSQKHTFLTQAKFWTSKYLSEGEDGLRHKENNDVYSTERKLAMIDPVMRMEISIAKQSKVTGINVGTLCAWIKRYKLLGIDGIGEVFADLAFQEFIQKFLHLGLDEVIPLPENKFTLVFTHRS